MSHLLVWISRSGIIRCTAVPDFTCAEEVEVKWCYVSADLVLDQGVQRCDQPFHKCRVMILVVRVPDVLQLAGIVDEIRQCDANISSIVAGLPYSSGVGQRANFYCPSTTARWNVRLVRSGAPCLAPACCIRSAFPIDPAAGLTVISVSSCRVPVSDQIPENRSRQQRAPVFLDGPATDESYDSNLGIVSRAAEDSNLMVLRKLNHPSNITFLIARRPPVGDRLSQSPLVPVGTHRGSRARMIKDRDT